MRFSPRLFEATPFTLIKKLKKIEFKKFKINLRTIFRRKSPEAKQKKQDTPLVSIKTASWLS